MRDYILEDLIDLAYQTNKIDAEYLVFKMIQNFNKDIEILDKEIDYLDRNYYCEEDECNGSIDASNAVEVLESKRSSIDKKIKDLQIFMSSLRLT